MLDFFCFILFLPCIFSYCLLIVLPDLLTWLLVVFNYVVMGNTYDYPCHSSLLFKKKKNKVDFCMCPVFVED